MHVVAANPVEKGKQVDEIVGELRAGGSDLANPLNAGRLRLIIGVGIDGADRKGRLTTSNGVGVGTERVAVCDLDPEALGQGMAELGGFVTAHDDDDRCGQGRSMGDRAGPEGKKEMTGLKNVAMIQNIKR